MCGRVQLDLEISGPAMRRLSELLQKEFPETQITSGEKYPSDLLPVLTAGKDKPIIALMRWGFPMRGSSKLIINARSETASEKLMFRQALYARRCVLPTTGFYEWSHNGVKTKYLFRLADEPVLYLAGLYNSDLEQPRFIVLTQTACSSMIGVHDRMPVIMGQQEIFPWLLYNDFARETLRREGPELIKKVQ